MYFFLNTATHEQVTRSAPSRDPNDATTPDVNTRENKISMSRHSQLRKEIKLRKANEVETGEGVSWVSHVMLVFYNKRHKVVGTETSVRLSYFFIFDYLATHWTFLQLVLLLVLNEHIWGNYLVEIRRLGSIICRTTSKPIQLSRACC